MAKIITISLILIYVFFNRVVLGPGNDCPSRIVFFNVGQGDSALIQVECKDILIDGGPGDYVLNSLGRYMPYDDMHIDLVVLSHPHLDHLSGLIDVVDRYSIGEVWVNPVCYASDAYEIFLSHSQYHSVSKGDKYLLNSGYLSVEYPFTKSESKCDSKAKSNGNVNNDSVILLFRYKGYKILFTGDAEKELEEKLTLEWDLDGVDVLKAGHHCSNTSSSGQFLDRVKPKLAICSLAKKNRYGHPGEETISRFEERNIRYILLYRYSEYEIWLE